MQQSDAQARSFLEALDPAARVFTFQTVAERDPSQTALTKVDHGAFAAVKANLRRLNDLGAGVFVMVNEGDGKGRRAENVRRVRALFVDLDDAPLSNLDQFPLPPHIVVQSSGSGYHAYWLVEDVAPGEFSELQKALAAKTGGDPAVHDLPRVMRLPGFRHQKGEPFLTWIKQIRAHPKFKLAQIQEALGVAAGQSNSPEPTEPIAPPAPPTPPPTPPAQPANTPRHVTAKELVEALGGTWTGGNVNVRCPAHDDRNPSLSVREREDGRILLYCHAGCAYNAIVKSLLAQGLDPRMQRQADLPPLPPPVPNYTGGLRVVSATELLGMELPERGFLLDTVLPEKGLVMVHAVRGVGKTYFALGMAYAVALGGRFLKWQAPEPQPVLYIDGEMPAIGLKERVTAFTAAYGDPGDRLRLLTHDLQEPETPSIDITTPEGQAAIDGKIGDARLIVVDNLSTLCGTGIENEAESWSPVQQWALRHRRAGRTVVFVHHSGKSGQQRGTSRREDVLDMVINLRRPEDYTPQEGALFELHFEKSRAAYGDAVTALRVQLATDEHGQMAWSHTEIRTESSLDRVATELKAGKTQAEVARDLGKTPGRVSQLAKQAREEGLMCFIGV